MQFRSSFRSTPQIVLNLIIINSLVFFAQATLGGLNDNSEIINRFALHHYKSDVFQPYQLVTHMFMHGSFWHLLFNMFALWMFGGMMERVWGPKRFLIFFLICGFFAGLAQMGSYSYTFWNADHSLLSTQEMEMYMQVLRKNATVGASGAIMGVLAAYAYTFPNTELFIMPIPFPIKAKWAITAIILIDVFGGVADSPTDNVAHFAHIGGALCGLIIVFFWNRNNRQQFY